MIDQRTVGVPNRSTSKNQSQYYRPPSLIQLNLKEGVGEKSPRFEKTNKQTNTTQRLRSRQWFVRGSTQSTLTGKGMLGHSQTLNKSGYTELKLSYIIV